jgi:hypothetical protein
MMTRILTGTAVTFALALTTADVGCSGPVEQDQVDRARADASVPIKPLPHPIPKPHPVPTNVEDPVPPVR